MDERLISIGKIVRGYYQQLNRAEFTEKNFNLWIESLHEPMKTAFKKKGLDECKGVLNFQRFILELRDNGLEEFLERELTEEDYRYWIDRNG